MIVYRAISPPDQSATSSNSGPRYDSFSAQVDCENFVRRLLKSPSTANFAPHRELAITGSEMGPWTVHGYVDSQNSFGAMIRSNYVCTIRYQGDSVHLENIQID
jgi:hypothetical protein